MLVPHEGPWSGVLRMHLGVDIPTDGKGCVLSVLGKEYRWKTGKVVIFDDTYEHFAINLTDNIRVVLFMDYLRPLPLPLHWLNKFCIYIDSCRTTKYRSTSGVGGGFEDGIPAKQHSAQVLGKTRIHAQPQQIPRRVFTRYGDCSNNDALSVSQLPDDIHWC